MDIYNEVTSSKDSLERVGMTRAKGKDINLDKGKMYMVINVDEMSFPQQVSKAREVMGLSSLEMSKVLDVSTGYVSKLQSGTVKISPQQAYKLIAWANFESVPKEE